jgi:hypothetical protein
MSVDICVDRHAYEINPGDEIDLANDEYGENEAAYEHYAVVLKVSDDWPDDDGDLWVTIKTDQGTFNFPSYHYIKLKVDD